MASQLVPQAWDSKSVLFAHLDESPRRLVVGLDAEAPQKYYSFSATSSRGPGEIGVISSGISAHAAAVLMEGGRCLLLGHDTWLTWIDIETLAVVASQRLGGAFFDFFPVEPQSEIVVLHELGALRVDAFGTVKWSVDTDIVEDSTADTKGNLILTVMDGPRLVVSLTSGTVSR